jgi:protein-L-isoaspartate(D-aspartate) O-methyltransferase
MTRMAGEAARREAGDEWQQSARAMARTQLAGRGILDRSVLEAMARVPRHLFVRPEDRARAWDDCALPLGCGATISQPLMVATMTELVLPVPGDRVLEVGTGSGYQAAVLAELGCEVYSVECVPDLADAARRRLAALGYGRVEVRCGDGTEGWPEAAPFDAILVTAGAPSVPETLVEQLAVGGRLVVPVGDRMAQLLHRVTRHGAGLREEVLVPCVFVPLHGREGWPE